MKKKWIMQARANLFDAIIKSKSLQELAECAYAMLGNPICIASANGEIICHVNGGRQTDDPLWEGHLASGFISKDVKFQTEVLKSTAAGRSFIWERKMGRYRIMMNNILNRQGIALRITMLEFNRQFTENDKDIFEIFTDSVYYFMRDTKLARDFDSDSNEYFLYEILCGRISISASASEISERLGIKENDRFALLLTTTNHDALCLVNIKNDIQSIFTNSIAVEFKKRLVCFIILRDGETVSNCNIIHLASLACKNKYQICLSRTITDIKLLKHLFNQSMDMLNIGVRTGKEVLVFLAESMGMLYLLSKLKKEDIRAYCYCSVQRLFALDKCNNTDLFRTLYAYLLSFGSISFSAELLGIHYNTMKQRVKELEDVVGYDMLKYTPVLFISIKAVQLLFPADFSFLYELDYQYKLLEEGGTAGCG